MLFSTQVFAAQVNFTSNSTWTVPANVYNATFEVWAAGGGGGGTGSSSGAGSGGGGGAYARSTISVSANQVYNISVGVNGSGGSGAAAGVKGGASWIFNTTNTTIVNASGGNGGGAPGAGSSGGAGGNVTGSTGQTILRGGDGGANVSSSISGAGGGGAGNSTVGNNATKGIRGTGGTTNGGNGGTNNTANGVGQFGANYGGGGGGSVRITGSGSNGGNGGAGFVQIEYNSAYINFTSGATNSSSINIDDTVKFMTNLTSSSVLDTYWINWNATGAQCTDGFLNVTQGSLSGTTYPLNISLVIPSECGGKTIGWKVYANNSEGLYNVSTTQTFTINTPAAVTNIVSKIIFFEPLKKILFTRIGKVYL